MGYRIRVLGKNKTVPQFEALQQAAMPGVLDCDQGVADDWEALILKHSNDDPIAFIEKNPVVDGEIGAEELQEFIEEMMHYQPASAATWLSNYLPDVQVIYSFQLLSGTDVNDGWGILHKVYGLIWNSAGGILQADGEGFSNEDGYTVLWQFSDGVTGEWSVGVLGQDGHWVNFRMDLANTQHREAFWKGQVPVGAKLV